MTTQPVQPMDFNPRERSFTYKESAAKRALDFVKSLYTRKALLAEPFVLGVDLSHWNESVDFPTLFAAGFRFVILKATEATYYTDPTFSTRWQQALQAGFIVGTYHFFRSNYGGGNQADYHLDTIMPLLSATGGRVIPACNDVETADGVSVSTRVSRITAWHQTVATAIKRAPLCYSSQYLWQTLTANMVLPCIGWAAHWTSASTYLWPVGWPVEGRKFVQFGIYPKHSWVPEVPGVTGEVDVNKFLGTLDELRTFVGMPSEPTHDEKVEIMWDEYLKLHPQ